MFNYCKISLKVISFVSWSPLAILADCANERSYVSTPVSTPVLTPVSYQITGMEYRRSPYFDNLMTAFRGSCRINSIDNGIVRGIRYYALPLSTVDACYYHGRLHRDGTVDQSDPDAPVCLYYSDGLVVRVQMDQLEGDIARTLMSIYEAATFHLSN